MQHYTFAVNAFVEMVKQFGMDEYEFAVHEQRRMKLLKMSERSAVKSVYCI